MRYLLVIMMLLVAGGASSIADQKQPKTINTKLKYFRGIPWGSSPEKVKASWNECKLTPSDSSNNDLSGDCMLGNSPAFISFDFVNGKLYFVGYVITMGKEYNSVKYVQRFMAWANLLTQKYGNPDEAQFIYPLGNCTNMTEENCGSYLALGFAKLQSTWTSETTKLKLSCFSDKSNDGEHEMICIISYTTTDQKLLARSEENNTKNTKSML